MNARVMGIGLATPHGVADQEQATRLALEITVTDAAQRGLVEGLYKRAGVRSRASATLNSTRETSESLDQSFFPSPIQATNGADHTRWPTTADRMDAFERLAAPLAESAAVRALREAGVIGSDITHLITVSCTGLLAPGVDVDLVRRLGLPADVQRLNLGFMGCHGGIVALRTAAALAEAHVSRTGQSMPRAACVLAVCVELCTLHLQRTGRADQHVANALFGDGAAAVVVMPAGASGTAGAARPSPLRVLATSSMLFEDSTSAMSWRIGDHGFAMTLDRTVPAMLQARLADWVWPWLRSELGTGVSAAELRWAIHPGGPRVLDAVEVALGLDPAATSDSRGVLSEQGNMSSATVLFILRRMLARPGAALARVNGAHAGVDHTVTTEERDPRPVVMLAFGPGLTGEAALLT